MPSGSINKPAGNGLTAGPGMRLAASGGWEHIPNWQPPTPQPAGMAQWRQQLGPAFSGGFGGAPMMPRMQTQLDPMGGWMPLGGWPGGVRPAPIPEPQQLWQPTEIHA